MAIHDRHIEQALRAFAQALRSGTSLHHYVNDGVAASALPEPIRQGLARGLETGTTLASVFARLDLLTDADLAVLRAGEQSGCLDQTLESLADAIAERRANRRKLFLGLAYPIVLLNFASCVLPIPLVLSDGLPIYLSTAVWIPALTVVLLVVFGVLVPRSSPRSRLRTAPLHFGLKIPVFGRALQRGTHGVFAEVLAKNLKAGLPMPVSLQTAIAASGDPALLKRQALMLRRIDQGGTLHSALASTQQFHPSLLAAVGQGELNGTLDDTLFVQASEEHKAQRNAIGGLIAVLVTLGFLMVLAVISVSVIEGFQGYLNTLDSTINNDILSKPPK